MVDLGIAGIVIMFSRKNHASRLGLLLGGSGHEGRASWWSTPWALSLCVVSACKRVKPKTAVGRYYDKATVQYYCSTTVYSIKVQLHYIATTALYHDSTVLLILTCDTNRKTINGHLAGSETASRESATTDLLLYWLNPKSDDVHWFLPARANRNNASDPRCISADTG